MGSLVLLVAAFLFFLSTFTKNWLVKNSEELIGRKLAIGEMHFNYARVAVQVKALVLYEANKTDSFASFNELYVNFDPWKLISGEYSFSEIRLAEPRVQVIQEGEIFNFDTLIPEPDSLEQQDTLQNEELKFTIRNIQLIDGMAKYHDLQKNNVVEMKNMNLNLPLIAWNNEQSNMGVDFTMGEKGKVNVQATVDNLKKKYQIDIKTQDIDLHPLTVYLKDYLDAQSIEGWLTSNLKMVGDMKEIINITLTGEGAITDLSLIDSHSEKIFNSPRLSTSINDINLKTFHFGFGKVELTEPHLLVVRDKDMTNLERLLLPYFHNDSIESLSDTIISTEEGTTVTYRIDTIRIDNGFISIADNTLNRPFKYELNDMNVTMTGLSEKAEKIPVVFNTKLNNLGQLTGKTTWSMTDLMNVEMEAKVERLDLVSFSPYAEYYIASPITQGLFNYDFNLHMEPTRLINQNKLKVDELEFGKRTGDSTAVKAPVRLALYIIKDVRDVIAIDLPVEGNPSDPKFKLGKLILKTFGNFMVKTAASPFKALAGIAGTNPESLEKVPFQFVQDSIDQKQRDDLSKLAIILKKKPDLILTLAQTTDPEEEMAQIAVRLAKEDYLASHADTMEPLQISVIELKDNDPNLLAYIRGLFPAIDSVGFSEACNQCIDRQRIETRFQEIVAERNRQITDLLTIQEGIPLTSVHVKTADLQNLPKELRVPQFKVEVSVK